MTNVKPFNLKQVRLLEGPFQEAMRRDRDYLLQLAPDRLLHTFRLTAGLPTDAEPYGGWEAPDCQLRGHSLGHYLSACSLMYASSGEEVFKTRVDYIVAELGKCQDALPSQGYNPGFLSAYPETFFDLVDERDPVWAPYYTLHKILAGLLDAHEHCDNPQALMILEKLAEWLLFRTRRLTQEQMQISLLNEPGGITEALARLYAITQKPEHRELLLVFNHELVLDPLARGEDLLDRLHANTQIPKAIGAALQYEVTGDSRSRRIAEFFWQRVALARSYAIGGNSDDELFFPVDRFSQHLTPKSAETCNTYNMLKLTRHIFSWEPSTEVMDFYERALFNHILGSQDPETGMMTYFVSHKPGHVKVYNTPENSFWCCTGTGMENHAKYGDTIYYHDEDSLYVNLFIASELMWEEKGLQLRQETRFPEESSTRILLTCEQPVNMTLKFRYPAWAQDIQITINGQRLDLDVEPGMYVSMNRQWQDGDQIDVRLPMKLRLETLPNAPDWLVFLYGPLVLVGALGTENMPDVYLYDPNTRSAAINHLPTPPVPSLESTHEQILDSVVAVTGKPLTFAMRSTGLPTDVELAPFYRLHHQRYTIYWKLQQEA
jgi:uncharacterized protein